MQYREMPNGFFLVLDQGDEILEGITRFATETGTRAAMLQGIGAVNCVTLGFYDLALTRYERQQWKEDLEVASLMGNIAVVDGGPFPHIHGVFGRRDFSTIAGHVFEAIVSVSVELAVISSPDPILRQAVDFCDLKLMQL